MQGMNEGLSLSRRVPCFKGLTLSGDWKWVICGKAFEYENIPYMWVGEYVAISVIREYR